VPKTASFVLAVFLFLSDNQFFSIYISRRICQADVIYSGWLLIYLKRNLIKMIRTRITMTTIMMVLIENIA